MTKTTKFLNAECRTCFNANKRWNPLTTKTRDYKKRLKSFGDLLEEITQIKSKDNKYPALPQFICVNCSRRLKSAHTFIQQAKEVNAKLYSMLNEKLGCLQETQIDLEEPCIEIKVENLEAEAKKENFHCLQETQIDLEACTEIKIENKEQELMKEGKLDCLQEVEIDIEAGAEIKVAENKQKDKLQEIVVKDIKEVEEINSCELQTTESSKNSIETRDDSESESMLSNDSDWEETKKLLKPKGTFSTENKDLTDIAVPCNKCNKIFKNSKLLAVHQRISHIPEEKKCTCHLCGNKFTRYCNMYKHMRMFHGPETVTLISKRPEEDYIYKCDLCPKKYSRKKSLVYHTKLKHSSSPTREIKENKTNIERKEEKSADKGSLCPICGCSFTSKNQLTVHLRRHTGERPFKCDLCDRAFLLVTQLNSHKRVHTGEKPYKCQVCSKAFRVSDDLRQHMRTHTNIRPHKCSQCERSFKHPQDLKIHLRSHTGERPYVCAVCGDTFQRYNTLRAHRIRMGHVENSNLVQNDNK